MKAEALDRMDGLGCTTQGSLVVQRIGLHIPQIPVHAVLHRVSRALEVRDIPRLAQRHTHGRRGHCLCWFLSQVQGRTCTNLTLLCTCASVRILSGVEGSRWIIRVVHRLHSVNTDEAPGMSPRSLRKGQSYLARHFIFLQLGEARLSHGYQKVIREESQAPPTQV